MTKRKIFLFLFLPLAIILALAFWRTYSLSKLSIKTAAKGSQSVKDVQKYTSTVINQNDASFKNTAGFVPPLDRTTERVTKKPFGIFITPQNFPVSPEKFRGYHTGVDFEIFPGEIDQAVMVKAICDGKLLLKESATGYGGVAVEVCTLDGAPITVVYGHLKLTSIPTKVGSDIATGDILGILGADKSAETDGERKHLHLGIHKGKSMNILGYVQSEAALSGWIDPCLYVCK